MFSCWQIRVLLIGTVLFGVGIGLLMAAIPNQGRTQFFGSSGGNVNDISKSFCCSGTLGSLVKDSSGLQYILSNNHVLADTDQAAPGENVSQPGLIDNNCRPATTVAHFTVAPHLGTNVDAALAKLVAGTMNSGGSILGIGAPNSTPVSAKINMGVAKSGTHYWPHLRRGAICEHERQSAVSERLQSGPEIHHQLHQSGSRR